MKSFDNTIAIIRQLRWIAAACSFVLVLLTCISASAQSNATRITGNVTDESGLPLGNASVVIMESGKGVYTDDNGQFIIKNLTPENIH